MKNSKENITSWHKLDNNANIFPAIAGKNLTSVYRLSAILIEDIKPEFLKQALLKTINFFPIFKVRLKHGLFWDYLETNNLIPDISEENGFPCRYIDPKQNNLFLFRVSYYKKRINLEIFHALTDGTGGMRFLKALCYQYIMLNYKNDFTEKERDEAPGISYSTNAEDSYLKNYKPNKMGSYNSEKAYMIKGNRFPLDAVGIIHIYFSVNKLKEICKNYDCSFTQYIAACIYWGIYNESLNRVYPKKSVNIFIPVNLRPYFNSTTSLNFFSGITLNMHFKTDDIDFKTILENIKDQFKEKLTKEAMASKLAYTVGGGYSMPIRIVPLPIKRFALRQIYFKNRKANTITITNLGKVEIAEKFEKYFENFYPLLSPSKEETIKTTVNYFKDTLTFSISTVLSDTSLQKSIIRKMVSDGLDITIESNGAYNETM